MADERDQLDSGRPDRLGETVCFVLLIFAVWDIAHHGHTLALPETKPETAPPVPAPQPKWTRREVGALRGADGGHGGAEL